LYDKKLDAPFIPKLGDNFDKKYCEGPDKIGETTKGRYEKYIREENFQIAFRNFTVFNIVNFEESNSNSNKNQSAKFRKDSKDNSNSNTSTKIRPMHMRSSSVSVPSSTLLNHNNINGSYYNNLPNRDNLMNNNSNNNLNNTILKSKVKIIDRDMRSSSNLGVNNLGINASNTLRGGMGSYHKHTQSFNNIYGNLIQMNNSNSNFVTGRIIEKSAEKRSTPIIQDSSKSIKIPSGRLPNINNIDKLKIKKLVNSSSSNLLFKYYKQNSINSNSSTGASLTNQIFGKKNMGQTASYSNLNY